MELISRFDVARLLRVFARRRAVNICTETWRSHESQISQSVAATTTDEVTYHGCTSDGSQYGGSFENEIPVFSLKKKNEIPVSGSVQPLPFQLWK